MSKFKQLLNKTIMKTKKNSPAILTGLGIIGLGATAVLAYKSRHKVEEVVLNIEVARENEEQIDKVEVAKDLVEALYLPVLVGTASVASIYMSYRIQNNRIAILAGSLALSQAQNSLFHKKYRELHGEEKYVEFITPKEQEVKTITDAKGKEKQVKKDIKKEVDQSIGQWYDESTEYVSDDHAYNVAMIDSITEKLEMKLFQRGSLLLNEVREALGFERIRVGALLGWTAADAFSIEKIVTMMNNEETGECEDQIWVTWATPRYIYDEVEFNGRYAI